MDFDYSFLGRALSDILMNFAIKRIFHKIVGNNLISWATIGITGNTVYWMCTVLWWIVYCFSVLYIFFSFTQHLNYCLKLFSVANHNQN